MRYSRPSGDLDKMARTIYDFPRSAGGVRTVMAGAGNQQAQGLQTLGMAGAKTGSHVSNRYR
jgi:hypothetical protein